MHKLYFNHLSVKISSVQVLTKVWLQLAFVSVSENKKQKNKDRPFMLWIFPSVSVFTISQYRSRRSKVAHRYDRSLHLNCVKCFLLVFNDDKLNVCRLSPPGNEANLYFVLIQSRAPFPHCGGWIYLSALCLQHKD